MDDKSAILDMAINFQRARNIAINISDHANQGIEKFKESIPDFLDKTKTNMQVGISKTKNEMKISTRNRILL